ncbi:TPA: molecular chaperone [Klebsiella quasipneumoniae subsp. similipneumoniae]|nr:molecular chaperone [Klebsiella quasipneumoniae subsp. similipneumoniae]HBT4732684.1 molecular chaperone [Klebsiella quasipneumoniae subsp. similipneumoniae]HBT4803901.1 molecular chaperone [Klebsiella quasipneumoniae subsp. similipneumoniae]
MKNTALSALTMKAALVLFTLFFSLCASSATWINRTRIILSEQNKDVTFSVFNDGDLPALMQLWSDRDNLLDRPETIKMPFLITPPVFRLDAKKSRTVRLQLLQEHKVLPQNVESLFWLNVLEVPPKRAAPGSSNLLQMAFRTRIKLFYRPASVRKASLEKGVKQLTATQISCGHAQCLRLKSTSPLHITLLNITLVNGTKISNLPQDGMIAPLSSLDIPLPAAHRDTALKAVTWVDDYGVANYFPQ